MRIKSRSLETVEEGELIKQIALELGIPEEMIKQILELEIKITKEAVKMGKKIVKKNYLTFVPRLKKAHDMVSPITKEAYHVPQKKEITVHVGAGFKAFISNKRMPDKICRFVKNA